MVVGKSIVSAFAGAADPNSFPNLYEVSITKTIQPKLNENNQKLEALFQEVRQLREQETEIDPTVLQELISRAEKLNKNWLLYLELYELASNDRTKQTLLEALNEIKKDRPQLAGLIEDGLIQVKTSQVR